MRHSLLHDACAFDHLRQKHFALAKQVSDHVHAIHEWAFNHMQRPASLGFNQLPDFFSVRHDVLVHTVDQRV